jgi:ligand-binding sensor domain-containing protein
MTARDFLRVCHTYNSQIPSNSCNDLNIDSQGNLWFFCGNCLVKFDRIDNWTIYDNTNSIFSNGMSLAIDESDNVWIGRSREKGILKFDGEVWTEYNRENSAIPYNINVNHINIDSRGDIWFLGNASGLTYFDGIEDFMSFRSHNSPLNYVYFGVLYVDSQDRKWLNGYDGMHWFDSFISYCGSYLDFIDSELEIIYPANNSFNLSLTPVIKWGLNPYYSNYEIEISTDESFSNENMIVFSSSVLTDKNFGGYNLPSDVLEYSSQYYLRIRGLASVQNSSWSEIHAFRTQNNIDNWQHFADFSSLVLMKNPDHRTIMIGTNAGLIPYERTFNNLFRKENGLINNINSGIPDNKINCLTRDRRNRYWIGTDNGLILKESIDWIVYNKDNSAIPEISSISGFADNKITTVFVDRNNTVWAGIFYGGILKIENGVTSLFNPYHPSSTWYCNFKSICDDDFGNIWLADQYGLWKFDGQEAVIYTSLNSQLVSSYVTSVAHDGTYIWAGTNNGLSRFDGTNWETFTIDNSGLPSNNINSLCFGQGILWIGTNNGLIKYANSIWTVYNSSTHPYHFESNNIGDISVYCSSYNGKDYQYVYLVNGNNLVSFKNIEDSNILYDLYKRSNTNTDFPYIMINDIQIDQNNRRWIATNKGLAEFDGCIWNAYNTNNSGLQNNNVLSLQTDIENHLWVGTQNGLCFFDYSDWTIYNTENSSFTSNTFYDIAIEEGGDVWAVTDYEASVLNDDIWNRYDYYNTNNSLYFYMQNPRIVIDNNNNKFIGYHSGLASFNNTSWTRPLTYQNVRSLAVDNDNTIWVGTEGYGLYYNNGSGWYQLTMQNSGLPDNSIYAIYNDSENIKWIGTSKGLIKYDGSSWISFTTDNSGIISNRINTIDEDSFGNLWIGTSNGLTIYNENGIAPFCIEEEIIQEPCRLNPPSNIRASKSSLSSTILIAWDPPDNLVLGTTYWARLDDDYEFRSLNAGITVDGQYWSLLNRGIRPPLPYNNTYYIKVTAQAPNCLSATSEIYSFYLEGNPSEWEVTNTGIFATVVVLESAITESINESSVSNHKNKLDKVLSNGDQIISLGDYIGIFYLDDNNIYKCGGYGIWDGNDLEITVFGDDPFTEIKDGFSDGEKYLIRIFSNYWGKELESNLVFVDEEKDFYSTDSYSFLSYIEAIEPDINSIQLLEGWNLVSSYIDPEINDIEGICVEIAENLLLIRNSEGQIYFPSLGINTIGNWNITQGYKAYMMEEATLDIYGTKIVPEETPIELPQGWNWIAYLRDTEMSVVTAMEDIVDDILLVRDIEGNIYFPDLNINTLGNLEPSQGYMIYMMEGATLTYPANGSPRQVLKTDELTPKATYIVPEIHRTGNSMSLVIETESLLNGSEIGIWTSNNVLVGSGKVHNGKAAITVWGDNEQTEQIDGARQLEGLKVMIFDKESGMSYEIELSNIHSLSTSQNQEYLVYNTEDIVMAKAVTQSSIHTDDLSLTCKPNPTTGETVIEYSLEAAGHVSIKLYSMSGQLIQILTEAEMITGIHSLNFDGSRLANGVYNLQMIVDGKSVNRLLVVSK